MSTGEKHEVIDRGSAIAELQRLQVVGDREHAHRLADQLLCLLLVQQGWGDVVHEYEKIDKWYA